MTTRRCRQSFVGVRTAIVAVALCILASPTAQAAAQCSTRSKLHGVIAKALGDTYNQIASDGDDTAASYFAKGDAEIGSVEISLQTHYSQYYSQHAGTGSLTLVHTIAGPTISVPWFVATDRSSEFHVGACTRLLRTYAGVGYFLANSNYSYPIGYGTLHGLGAGIERFANPEQRFDIFGSAFYYPAASGQYGPLSVTYGIISFDGEVRWRLGSSAFGLIFGLYEEMRTLHPSARAGLMIRDGPYVGLDF